MLDMRDRLASYVFSLPICASQAFPVMADKLVMLFSQKTYTNTVFFLHNLPLPYVILPDDGSAKFDKPKKELQLVLPVAVNEENLKRAQLSTVKSSHFSSY